MSNHESAKDISLIRHRPLLLSMRGTAEQSCGVQCSVPQAASSLQGGSGQQAGKLNCFPIQRKMDPRSWPRLERPKGQV